jgi:predicted nucleic acid-binding Zn finger protein
LAFKITREAIIRGLGSDIARVLPDVLEYRFVKVNIKLDNEERAIWIYTGRQRDYVLVPGLFCSCKDFTLRTIIGRTSNYCKHQLGLYVAISRKKYLELTMLPNEAYTVIMEVIDKGFSPLLRKKMSKTLL